MTDSFSFDEARSFNKGSGLRFTELQRVTNPLMRWIIHKFQVVSTGVVWRHMDLLKETLVSPNGKSTYCRFFYISNTTFCRFWLQGKALHLRPSGYEPDALLLSYPAV